MQKKKATSNSLVHRFLECYVVEDKSFRVRDQVISFDVSNIARVTGLSDSGEATTSESSSFLDAPSWYFDLCREYVSNDERRKKEKTQNIAEKYTQGNGKTKSKRAFHKASVLQVLNKMPIETEEAKLHYRKLLSFYLISFFVAAPSDDSFTLWMKLKILKKFVGRGLC